jgi:flagellar biosynthetic protein FliR
MRPLDISFATLLLFICVLVRTSVFVMFLPVFPKQGAARYAKIGVVFALAALLTSVLADKFTLAVDWDSRLIFIVLQEIGVGCSMGFLVLLFEETLWSFGTWVSNLIGLDMVETLAPGMSTSSSALSFFCAMLGLVIFLCLDGHHFLLLVLVASFDAIPPGSFVLSPGLCQLAWQGWTELYRFLILMVSPFLLLFTVLTVELGILGKMVPQMNIFLMEYPLRLAAAFFLLAWFLPLYGQSIEMLYTMLQGLFYVLW